MKRKLLNYIPTITMLPAIVIGVIAMYLNGVAASSYLQNILCFIILSLASYFLLKSNFSFFKTKPILIIAVSIIVLLVSFIDTGIEGVHRWVAIGPFGFYVSAIVLPIIMINLWELLKKGRIIIAVGTIICTSIILTLQPDASVVTAFSVVSIILLWTKIKKIPYILIIVFLAGLTITTWVFLDGLASVVYVEGIFKLVSDMGMIWFILASISLIIMVIPFLIFPPKKNKILSICFGVYFIIILISNVFGNFPIPLMGYGISPIIGYFISIMWFTKTKI
ncbi:MAG: cell division protein [Sarcina sp.]